MRESSRARKKSLVFRSDARKHKDSIRRRKHLLETGRRAVVIKKLSLGQPWVVNFHRTAKRSNHRAKGPSEVPKANNAHPRTGKEEAILIALEAILLVPFVKSTIVFAHASREIKSERKSHFSHGDSKGRTGDQHANVARETVVVVDVRQVIAFNIKYSPQSCTPLRGLASTTSSRPSSPSRMS